MLSSRCGRGKGAYQRLMPISNSCPSWTSHFLTALTVKFTSRLNATKEYGGWRVNDSSVMRKERHSFPPPNPPNLPSFPPRRTFPQYGGFFFFLPSYTCAMFQWWRSLPVNLVWVGVSLLGNGLSCERMVIDFFFFLVGWCCGMTHARTHRMHPPHSRVDQTHKSEICCVHSQNTHPRTGVGVGVVVMVAVEALKTSTEQKGYSRIWSRSKKNNQCFLLFLLQCRLITLLFYIFHQHIGITKGDNTNGAL